jgi:uncharacterized membrane protein
MNQAHYHLLVNHLPIIIPIIGFLVMLGGIIFKSNDIKKAAFLIFVLGAICTFPAAATGDGAEEIVENLPGVSEQIIHTHEEAAEVFIILSYILGVVSLAGFLATWKQKSYATIFTYVVLIYAAVVLFFASRTGTTGGEIRHSEIRNDTGQNITPESKPTDEDED